MSPNGRKEAMSQALFVCAAAVLAAAPSARAEKTQAISVEHGVTVIHGHLDTTTILPESKVKILEPIVGPGHDPNARWLEWVDTYRIAAAHAVEPAPPRIRRPAPPWQYTPTDFTYTPKTDWTYHPRVGRYQRTPVRAYTPKTDWTYHPKRFGRW
jgi:hypothetical protein